MFIKVLLLGIVLMAIVFMLMGISMLIKKNGKFPNMHIGSNKNMKERGITCATSTDRAERKIKIKPLHLR